MSDLNRTGFNYHIMQFLHFCYSHFSLPFFNIAARISLFNAGMTPNDIFFHSLGLKIESHKGVLLQSLRAAVISVVLCKMVIAAVVDLKVAEGGFLRLI